MSAVQPAADAPGKAVGDSDVAVAVEPQPVPPPAAAKTKAVSYFQLFRFCEPLDVWLYVFGTLGSIGQGVTFPAFTYIFVSIFFCDDWGPRGERERE